VLQGWTGRRWVVAIAGSAPQTETVRETRERNRAAMMDEVRADPLVKRVLDRFPGAEIVGVRDRFPAVAETVDQNAQRAADAAGSEE